jgi:hypothetical protein
MCSLAVGDPVISSTGIEYCVRVKEEGRRRKMDRHIDRERRVGRERKASSRDIPPQKKRKKLD